MAKLYFDRLKKMMADINPGLSSPANLEIKHFFSGAAVYAEGRICISLTPAGFALKLPSDLRQALMVEEGAGPLRYFPKAPVKVDYVVLPQRLVDDGESLCFWVDKSIAYVLAQPQPKQ